MKLTPFGLVWLYVGQTIYKFRLNDGLPHWPTKSHGRRSHLLGPSSSSDSNHSAAISTLHWLHAPTWLEITWKKKIPMKPASSIGQKCSTTLAARKFDPHTIRPSQRVWVSCRTLSVPAGKLLAHECSQDSGRGNLAETNKDHFSLLEEVCDYDGFALHGSSWCFNISISVD